MIFFIGFKTYKLKFCKKWHCAESILTVLITNIAFQKQCKESGKSRDNVISDLKATDIST